jgi:hypothetical protein
MHGCSMWRVLSFQTCMYQCQVTFDGCPLFDFLFYFYFLNSSRYFLFLSLSVPFSFFQWLWINFCTLDLWENHEILVTFHLVAL